MIVFFVGFYVSMVLISPVLRFAGSFMHMHVTALL